MRINSQKKKFISSLRKNQTDAEKLLWFYLRNKRFEGIKFRRQQLIGNYIVDFVSFEKKLIIELDGGQHNDNENIIKDKTRSEFLEKEGFTVLRYWNNEILVNTDVVLESIYNSLFPSP